MLQRGGSILDTVALPQQDVLCVEVWVYDVEFVSAANFLGNRAPIRAEIHFCRFL